MMVFGAHGRAALLPLGAALLVVAPAAQADSFLARDVQVRGLVRLTAPSVLAPLPVQAGQTVTDAQIAESIRQLFATGNFEDISAQREGDQLVFTVTERPVIGKISLKGNKLIPEDTLRAGMKGVGLTEGEVLKRAVLQNIVRELRSQYAQQGRYDADVQVSEIPRPNNRVDLAFTFLEGHAAKVVNINLIGNSVFSDRDIRQAFAVKESSWSSILTRDDRYARERLAASLESLRSLYLNKGYVNFTINSAQLNLSADKKKVFVEVSVSEGQQYRFGQIRFLGTPLYRDEELRPLLTFKPGEQYSQARVDAVRALLARKYGNSGYYFADIKAIPQINEAERTVDLNYFINPDKQVYVRRINFSGNNKTADEVLRREMRQLEAALASNEKIELSKQRLERTGYFKTVNLTTSRVPNTTDQIDINVQVEEQTSGTSTLAVGYSQSGGVTFQAGLDQINFLGTGNRVSLDLSRSETQDSYNISTFNPYFTVDGISRGYNVYYRKTKLDNLNISNYVTDSLGGGISFGYPLDETKNFSASLNVDDTTVKTGPYVAKAIQQFLQTHDGKLLDATTGAYEGQYLSYNLGLNWTFNTLNRPVFPTSGQSHRVSLDVALPGSDLEYQRLSYDGQVVFPLGERFALKTYTTLGYGHDLPFYKNFFAGGYGSVRGWRNNTLGPRSPSINSFDAYGVSTQPFEYQEPIGGNALIELGAELVLPVPFRGDWTRQIRPVLFAEGAQVYDTSRNSKIDLGELRYSVGAGFTWITAIGPLSLSYAYPLNSQDGDEVKRVQFEIGRLF